MYYMNCWYWHHGCPHDDECLKETDQDCDDYVPTCQHCGDIIHEDEKYCQQCKEE